MEDYYSRTWLDLSVENYKKIGEIKKKALEKIKGEKYKIERIEVRNSYAVKYEKITFENKDIDITAEEVACALCNFCFGGICSKVAPGVFRVKENTD